jgi:hypothetical protein
MRIWLYSLCLWSLLVTTALGQTSGAPDARADTEIDPLDDPRIGLLTPIPAQGAVPPIVGMLNGVPDHVLAQRAQTRAYAEQIRRIKREHLGTIRKPQIRAEGIRQLREFTDPAAFAPLIQELRNEKDDVRLAVLDHLAGQGQAGQAALAWMAIYEASPSLRYEAMGRMVSPPPGTVLQIVDGALRSGDHAVANAAGALAGALNIIESIPLLIFAQATATPTPQDQGDLAWIAVGTQITYVQNVEPVVGSGAGAFAPVMGVINEGTVMRVQDAVVIVYRTEIHHALVSMTSQLYGQSTAHLGYDLPKWWAWYNDRFLPHLAQQQAIAELENG